MKKVKNEGRSCPAEEKAVDAEELYFVNSGLNMCVGNIR